MISVRTRHVLAALALASTLIATGAHAAPLIFDRGLPTANLNDAAGALRSNVGWDLAGFGWFNGDDFTLAGSGNYLVNEIKFWLRPSTAAGVSSANNDTNTGNDAVYALGDTYSALGFYLGNASSTSVPLLAAGNFAGAGSNATDNLNISITRALYNNATENDYQAAAYGQFFEVTISNLNLSLTGGVLYQFGAECRATGDSGTPPGPPYGTFTVCFAHSSNAALSGSPQDGADGQLRALWVDGLAGPATYDSSYSSSDPGGGWDKASDVNIQVFGEAIPEPATLALLGLGLAGLGFSTRRRS